MPRPNVMRHMMLGENLALITSRMTKGETFKHAQVSRNIVEVICMSPKTSNNGFVFPLYLYPNPDQKDLFSHLNESKERKPNISEKIFTALSETYKAKPSPEDIFYYIYAVFYSNTFRTKYAEFLKTDFPRVPFTKDKHLFKKLAEYGKGLTDLHLMLSPELDSPLAKFQGMGDKRVDKIKHDKEGERVYINNDQYFEGLEENVWEYRIGGYQVCYKWLKVRKGEILSLDDVKHYCKIATAIKETIDIQASIDEIYSKMEKKVIEF